MNKVINVRAEDRGIVFVEMADGRHGRFDVRSYMASDFFR